MKNIPECDDHLLPYAGLLAGLVPAFLNPLDVLKCAEPRAKELAGGKVPTTSHYHPAIEEFLRGLPLGDTEAAHLVTARANKLREEI